MTAIDWIKAPEGATHFDSQDENWLQQFSGVSLVWDCKRGWCNHHGQYPSNLSDLAYVSAKPLLQKENPVLIGSDLPPVGEVCILSGHTERLKVTHPEWAGRKVKIYAHFVTDHDRELAAYVSEDHMVGGVGTAELFLPIRTPEQIAAEALEIEYGEIRQIIESGLCGKKTLTQVIEQIQAAGYRKFEITDDSDPA